MIVAQLDLNDFDGMTVAEIKRQLSEMPEEAIFNLIPANHYGDSEYLEVTWNSKRG